MHQMVEATTVTAPVGDFYRQGIRRNERRGFTLGAVSVYNGIATAHMYRWV